MCTFQREVLRPQPCKPYVGQPAWFETRTERKEISVIFSGDHYVHDDASQRVSAKLHSKTNVSESVTVLHSQHSNVLRLCFAHTYLVTIKKTSSEERTIDVHKLQTLLRQCYYSKIVRFFGCWAHGEIKQKHVFPTSNFQLQLGAFIKTCSKRTHIYELLHNKLRAGTHNWLKHTILKLTHADRDEGRGNIGGTKEKVCNKVKVCSRFLAPCSDPARVAKRSRVRL